MGEGGGGGVQKCEGGCLYLVVSPACPDWPVSQSQRCTYRTVPRKGDELFTFCFTPSCDKYYSFSPVLPGRRICAAFNTLSSNLKTYFEDNSNPDYHQRAALKSPTARRTHSGASHCAFCWFNKSRTENRAVVMKSFTYSAGLQSCCFSVFSLSLKRLLKAV